MSCTEAHWLWLLREWAIERQRSAEYISRRQAEKAAERAQPAPAPAPALLPPHWVARETEPQGELVA